MRQLLNALAVTGALMVLGGCAGAPTTPTPSPTLAQTRAAPPHCVRETGTRAGPKDTCRAGRVYTGEQIRNTGALDVGEALELLGGL